jgi:hypothetical protein
MACVWKAVEAALGVRSGTGMPSPRDRHPMAGDDPLRVGEGVLVPLHYSPLDAALDVFMGPEGVL